MSDWTEGYVASIGYTHGYYTELNPVRSELLLLHAGLQPPAVRNACELGFGQGMSINVHAATTHTRWYGTDFNPSQALNAQNMAQAAGHGAVLADQSFAEFAARDDLPEFDFIGLHGIWSWINDDNRHVLVDFLRRKLAVGGVVYVSYNTLPGWSTFAPIRHLMTQYASAHTAPGLPLDTRINEALSFAIRAFESGMAYGRENPKLSDRLAKLQSHSRAYLAHEYFNRDWHPMYFSDMAEYLQAAKLQFGCSANPIEHLDNLHMTAAQLEVLQSHADLVFRQGLRDFLVNQSFRRDYWVRGAVRLSTEERNQRLREQRVVLTTPAKRIAMKLTTVIGEVTLTPAVYEALFQIWGDHQPRSLGETVDALEPQGISLKMVSEAVIVLMNMGHLFAAQPHAQAGRARPSVCALNRFLVKQARDRIDAAALASPVLAGAFPVNRVSQLLMSAHAEGAMSPESAAQQAWAVLKSRSQRLLREGKPIEGDEENLAEMVKRAQDFFTQEQPILQALGIDLGRTSNA